MTDQPASVGVEVLVERLNEQARKMDVLADLFDAKFPNDPNPEAQTNLREWAALLREAAAALRQAREERDREREGRENLLAVIHRDGGHYASDHGIEKAEKDAEAIVLHERAERDFLREREAYFASVLEVCDGGRYRNDWDTRIRAVVAERDSLRLELDAAEHNRLRDNEYLLGQNATLHEVLGRLIDRHDAENGHAKPANCTESDFNTARSLLGAGEKA